MSFELFREKSVKEEEFDFVIKGDKTVHDEKKPYACEHCH